MSNRHLLAFAFCLSAAFVGCGKPADTKPVAAAKTESESEAHGWWCAEHGVPEEVCALCDNKLVADFKAKNDWCNLHERPESQCFTCHPEKRAEFAALYEAKFGKQPPKPSDNGT